jgi:hypothetical protein
MMDMWNPMSCTMNVSQKNGGGDLHALIKLHFVLGNACHTNI